MMGYSMIEGPGAPVASAPGFSLHWSFETGPASQYDKVVLSEEVGAQLWTLIVDGSESAVMVPDLDALAALPVLGSGTRRVDITRVLNEAFDIDDYTTRDFSIWKRTSWSQSRSTFTVP